MSPMMVSLKERYFDYQPFFLLDRVAHLESYQRSSDWKTTFWHEKYGATRDDMERIQLFLYFIGANYWLGFFSLALSFLSATYGITKVSLSY